LHKETIYLSPRYKITEIKNGQDGYRAYIAEKKVVAILPFYKKLKYLYKSEFEDMPPWESVYFLTPEAAMTAIMNDEKVYKED
jgi:hypothetical protein